MIAYLAFKLIKYLKDSLMISTFCFDLHNTGGKKRGRQNFKSDFLKYIVQNYTDWTYNRIWMGICTTIVISRWRVSLCCWASTAAIAAAASFPNIAMFDFRSCSFASAASSFVIFSILPTVSLTFAWRFETSIACLSSTQSVITNV